MLRMLSKMKQWYRRQMFRPGLLGPFVNPFFITRRSLFRHVRHFAPKVKGRTLDVGCGNQPYRDLFPTKEYTGLELDTPENRRTKRADLFYDGTRFPFEEGSFETVIFFEVFEHVFNPDQFLSEVNRVLVAEGMVLVTVPMVWDEHEQPYDFARYTSFGLKHLFEKHGFEVVDQRKSVDDVRVVFQLLIEYLYKQTATSNVFVNTLVTAILMAPVTLLGELSALILPGNPDFFLDNVLLARKRPDHV